MKKVSLFFLVLCVSLGIKAQNLGFMGYQMGVSIYDFTDAVRQHFPLKKKVGGDQYFIYYGSVYGHDTYLKAEYTKKTHTVYKITVTPKQIDQYVLLDSLKVHHGEPMEVRGGYRWDPEGGTVFLYTPEGYDPVLMYFDMESVAKFREEK